MADGEARCASSGTLNEARGNHTALKGHACERSQCEALCAPEGSPPARPRHPEMINVPRRIRAHVLIPRHNGLNDFVPRARPTRDRRAEQTGGVFVSLLLSIPGTSSRLLCEIWRASLTIPPTTVSFHILLLVSLRRGCG